ncbi:MAG: ATP-binding cassette domain-containing protein [Syntrophaceticus sp.]|nr:ATP-binding cassette domain-containing protein [Syntrophaceticus sp.]MDD3315373.1 ATP-binding cassette domain-containing protein [Syntrophaceticus sp.]MDD4360626.1 ATP-binding cassette domain-containing protein [Syntrophaceticus sp.]MDD4783856.1 ATP-binding cassette domain-containing protein [Syntrophaceticus sp.]
MEMILNVKNLTKSFGPKKAVEEISLSVLRGEVMGLLGPNGAGKTTAIRMIMGILTPDAGEISFNFSGSPQPLDKRKIGYLPEERGLYEDVRVIDNLVYLAELKGKPACEARREGRQWLERFDLGDYADQKLEKLSKGMQQKVQFVASILHRPQLVLFDEPFSGLDPVNQDFFKDIIRQLQDGGTTVLLSAHQMNLVEELCDSIFLINHGRPVLSGKLQAIKESYKEDIVELRYDPAEGSGFLKMIPGLRILQEQPGLAVMRYSGSGDINALLQEFSSRLTVRALTVKKPPLHEIFIETVRERGEEIEVG